MKTEGPVFRKSHDAISRKAKLLICTAKKTSEFGYNITVVSLSSHETSLPVLQCYSPLASTRNNGNLRKHTHTHTHTQLRNGGHQTAVLYGSLDTDNDTSHTTQKNGQT